MLGLCLVGFSVRVGIEYNGLLMFVDSFLVSFVGYGFESLALAVFLVDVNVYCGASGLFLVGPIISTRGWRRNELMAGPSSPIWRRDLNCSVLLITSWT
jgi:hypothetical protein